MNKAITSVLIALLSICILYFNVWTQSAFELRSTFDYPKIKVIFVCCTIILFLIIADKLKKRFNTGLDYALCFLIFSCLLSAFYGINFKVSIFGAYKRFDGFVSLFCFVFVVYVIVCYINKNSIKPFINTLIFTTLFVSSYAIVQWAGLDWLQWSGGDANRSSSTFGHPNLLATYLTMVIPLLLYRIVHNKEYIITLVLIITLFAFYCTNSRGGYITLVISMAILACITLDLPFKYKVGGFALLMLLFLLVGYYGGFFARFIKPDHEFGDTTSIKLLDKKGIENSQTWINNLENTTFIRLMAYKTAIKIIKEAPVYGIGDENIGFVYKDYLKQVYNDLGFVKHWENQNRIHNGILDVTVERGFVGLAAYLFFWICYIRCYLKSNRDLLSKCLFVSVISSFIHNQFSFGQIATILLFWFLVGLSIVSFREENYNEERRYNTISHI